MHRDGGYSAYEEVKDYEAAQKLSTAKNSQVKASTNDAYILPKTVKVEQDLNYSNWYILKFDYKISVKSVIVVTLACQPHTPDQSNPFEYECTVPSDVSSKSYEWDPAVHGAQNTISKPKFIIINTNTKYFEIFFMSIIKLW